MREREDVGIQVLPYPPPPIGKHTLGYIGWGGLFSPPPPPPPIHTLPHPPVHKAKLTPRSGLALRSLRGVGPNRLLVGRDSFCYICAFALDTGWFQYQNPYACVADWPGKSLLSDLRTSYFYRN